MTEIAISQISISGWNPRKNFDTDALDELKKSIQEHGIIEPLIVRPHNNKENLIHVDHGYTHLATYELVAGERRFRAAQEIGLDSVPVVIKKLSDREVHEIMLIENLQRSQLDPLEEASSLDVLLREGSTQEELGKKLGKSQAWIANRLRLIKAPPELKEMLISREITPKHVITLLPLKEYPVFKEEILPELKEGLQKKGEISVKDLEMLINNSICGYDSKTVLNLDDPGYEHSDYKKFMNLSGCAGCKDIKTYPNWRDEKHRYCLNRRCWKDKINLAKQAYEKSLKENAKELAGKEAVDTNKLHWNQYHFLGGYEHFDESECKGCLNCKVSANDPDQLICIDTVCFEKKRKAHQREQTKKKREEEQKVFNEFEEWVAKNLKESERASSVIQNEGWDEYFCIPKEDFRGILRLLVRELWTESVKKALKPWGSVKNTDEFVKLVEEIEGEDLIKALFRLIFIQQLVGYGAVNKAKLERILCMYRGDQLPDEDMDEDDFPPEDEDEDEDEDGGLD